MNKIDLEVKIESLKKMVQDSTEQSDNYKKQLETVEKQLEDINKPTITPAMMDEVQEAIEKAVEDFGFSDTDNYSYEPEFDYDYKVVIGNLELDNTSDLVAEIAEKVLDLFQEADCPTDEENTRDDREAENVADNG